jgi:hypothetical protein
MSSDTGRIILIAFGVAILVLVLLPTLFMGGMMAAMMSGMMGGGMGSTMGLVMGGGILVLVLLGIGLIVAGVMVGSRGRRSDAPPPGTGTQP